MKRQHLILLLLLLLLASLTSCSPGHVGSNEIAFLRDGHLWTIDPDGANAFEVVSDGPPVVGYGWSPNHQILVYRSLDDGFAKTSEGKHLGSNPVTQLPGDLPSTLNTIGIDGGTPIPIISSSPDIERSNAWWNASGNRLLYREESATTNPRAVTWWVSQNDQPEGIARKLLPSSFSIPSFDSSSSLAIGNTEQGVFTTTLSGTNLHYLQSSALAGHPLPASLERVLWQPAHQHPALLFAVAPSNVFGSTSTTVHLVLRDANGHLTPITTCTCTQFAWSPDGNAVLYTTGASYLVFHVTTHSSFTISAEEGAVPYWSPDSQFLLLDGLHTLLLVQIKKQEQQVLLADTPSGETKAMSPKLPGVNELLQSVSNSLWAADSRHFLFLTRGRLFWQGQRLSAGKGLYTVTIDSSGKLQGTPSVVDTGDDSQAGWTYEDPNTSFLF